MRRFLFGSPLLFVGLWLLLTAAVAATAQETASQIAAVVLIAGPLVMPFVLKYYPKWNGHAMLIATGVVALVIAIAAGLISGLFKIADLGTYPGVVLAGTAVFGLAQFVFQIFNQNPSWTKYVK